MTMLPLLAALLPLQPAAAPPPPSVPPGRSPSEIVAAAPAAAWIAFAPDDLLVMELADGGRVVIALAPDFAPVHTANIRALAKAGWWNGTSINRVQDDYVVQWGDATEKKPLPRGIVAKPPAEYDRAWEGLVIRAMASRDSYAPHVGHVDGWPVATEGERAWLPHCYGMVGVGRNESPDTGTGAELYTMIGHSPRHLDRNVALLGRVVEGMERLSALPRGTEAMGFYRTPAQRTVIRSVRLASDMPAAQRPAFERMATDAPVFATWLAAKANRRDSFFVRPAGAVDICNALPPVRRVPAR